MKFKLISKLDFFNETMKWLEWRIFRLFRLEIVEQKSLLGHSVCYGNSKNKTLNIAENPQ